MVFGRRKAARFGAKPNAHESIGVGERETIVDGKRTEGKKTECPIARTPSTPEPVYTTEDVDSVDSPWLQECGMVRINSDDRGGCHIVPKESIQKDE